MPESDCRPLTGSITLIHAKGVRTTKRHTTLPIGRTARIAFQIDAVRADCCKAAQSLMKKKRLDEAELEECARLDDALAKVHCLLKATIRNIMISRISRRSRAKGR
jgi:hypothetical protein